MISAIRSVGIATLYLEVEMGKSFLRFATVLVMVLGFLLSPAYGAKDVEVLITKGDTLVHICEK